DDGLVDMRPGRGAVVTAAAGHIAELRDDIRALVDRAESLGVSTEVLAGLVRGGRGPTQARAARSAKGKT
ncbi:MAG: hypothetical protein ACTHX2_04505, partial [Microbacterium sp.]